MKTREQEIQKLVLNQLGDMADEAFVIQNDADEGLGTIDYEIVRPFDKVDAYLHENGILGLTDGILIAIQLFYGIKLEEEWSVPKK